MNLSTAMTMERRLTESERQSVERLQRQCRIDEQDVKQHGGHIAKLRAPGSRTRRHQRVLVGWCQHCGACWTGFAA